MAEVYRTLRVAPSDEGVLGVVIDAPPMNLIGPELVRDLVNLFGALESGAETRVVVLESADPDYFVPHVDLTKVAEYTAEAAKANRPDNASGWPQHLLASGRRSPGSRLALRAAGGAGRRPGPVASGAPTGRAPAWPPPARRSLRRSSGPCPGRR